MVEEGGMGRGRGMTVEVGTAGGGFFLRLEPFRSLTPLLPSVSSMLFQIDLTCGRHNQEKTQDIQVSNINYKKRTVGAL